jgi:small subunit ribosomal protein S10
MSYLIKINHLNNKNLNNKINIIKKNKKKNFKIIKLPTKIKTFTVLRSPHVDKKSREQYELRKFKILIKTKKISKKEIKNLIKKDNIFIKITKII